MKRPGVPTMKWKLRTWSVFFCCHSLCPPVMHITERWNGAKNDFATLAICSASSRVGTITIPMGPSVSPSSLSAKRDEMELRLRGGVENEGPEIAAGFAAAGGTAADDVASCENEG